MTDLERSTGIKQVVLDEISMIAKKHGVKNVILFGSRARGDFKRTSDIDLAVEGGDFYHFVIDVEEDTSTLLEYDFINLNTNMQEELIQSVRRDGVKIYEKI